MDSLTVVKSFSNDNDNISGACMNAESPLYTNSKIYFYYERSSDIGVKYLLFSSTYGLCLGTSSDRNTNFNFHIVSE